MSKYDELVKAFADDIGYKESPANSNKTKYGAWYGLNGQPWCLIAVQYKHNEIGCKLPYKSASCSDILRWYRANKPECVHTTPKKGYIVIYNFGHCGIVESVQSNGITAIEGNTSIGGSQSNGGEVCRVSRSFSKVTAYIDGIGSIPPSKEDVSTMEYKKVNNIHTVAVPASDFKIIMRDTKKLSAASKDYCNAGFFGNYDEGTDHFTLPVGHIVCDYDSDEKWTRHYCEERGTFRGNKYYFDASTWTYQNPLKGNAVSSLIVKNGVARIDDIIKLPDSCSYVISGIPIMREGKDVKFNTYVKGQGWGGSSLYGTYHIFVGLKKAESSTIYVMCMKTTTPNMILTAEAFRKFKALGFYDVIKLDGGGSTVMNVNGKRVVCTSENRQINNIITFQGASVSSKPNPEPVAKNPYARPKNNLRKGSVGSGVKWLQWSLNTLGYNCGKVDGIFGSGTLREVKNFQRDAGLDVDGIVGNLTKDALELRF